MFDLKVLNNLTQRLLNKGLAFILNIIILCVLLWLKFSSIDEFNRIFGNLELLIRNISPLILIGAPIIFGNKLANRVIFVLLVSIFLLAEVLLRVGVLDSLIAKRWDNSEVYRYPKPFVEFLGKPNSSMFFQPYMEMGGSREDATITLNELGFRGEIPSLPKGNEFRIIILGGSTVFNGIPLSKSIPGELEQLFHNDGFSEVKVYNWGVVSFNSGQELSLLVHSVADFNPDLVIVYDGANDIYHSYVFEPRPGYPYNWQTYETGLSLIRNGPSLSQIVNLLLLKSRLVTSVFGESLKTRIVQSTRHDLTIQTPASIQVTSQAYISNVKKMCNFSKGNDFKLAAILQPMIIFKNPLIGNEKNLVGNEEIQSYVMKSYQILEKEFESLARNPENKNQCYYANLSKIFSDFDKETYWDFVHTDNDGNKYIATQIYNGIKNQFNALGLSQNRRKQL